VAIKQAKYSTSCPENASPSSQATTKQHSKKSNSNPITTVPPLSLPPLPTRLPPTVYPLLHVPRVTNTQTSSQPPPATAASTSGTSAAQACKTTNTSPYRVSLGDILFRGGNAQRQGERRWKWRLGMLLRGYAGRGIFWLLRVMGIGMYGVCFPSHLFCVNGMLVELLRVCLDCENYLRWRNPRRVVLARIPMFVYCFARFFAVLMG